MFIEGVKVYLSFFKKFLKKRDVSTIQAALDASHGLLPQAQFFLSTKRSKTTHIFFQGKKTKRFFDINMSEG